MISYKASVRIAGVCRLAHACAGFCATAPLDSTQRDAVAKCFWPENRHVSPLSDVTAVDGLLIRKFTVPA
jgi:hypothetical protein